MTNLLLRDTTVKLKGKVKIEVMYDALIETAISKISQIQPQWQYVASKLYTSKLYAEAYGIKNKRYPHFSEIIKKGVAAKIYSKEVFENYSEEEIDKINSFIESERDFALPYHALKQFDEKYCKKYSKTKKLELPQMTYIRVAMGLAFNLTNPTENNGLTRVQIIKKLYNILSMKQATLATPIMLNAGTPLNSYASCILNTIGNDTWDIANKLATTMLYTKGAGGLAFDVSHIQAKGSLTRNNIRASGIVPYIKTIEEAMVSMVQSENRRGSAVITCNWWHYQIEDFLMLKDASSGTPENRALHLQYSMATNDFFLRKVKENGEVTLLDPVDVPELLYVYGDEFERKYEEACQSTGIRKKKISAKELYQTFLKYRFQTGNLYQFFTDTVNKTTMTNRFIGSSNLCQEIMEPSRPGNLIKESMITIDGKEFMTTDFENEEIALCNLASYNVDITDLPKEEMDEVIFIITLILDNTIDIGRYMRVAGKKTNLDYRYIGQGMTNYAQNLALKGIAMDTEEAAIETFKMFQKLSLGIIRQNAVIASKKGRYPKFSESKWAEGKIPFDLGNEKLKEHFAQYVDHEGIEEVKELISLYGVRNALMIAMAPTASSATSANLTEACEPIQNFSYRLEGAVTTQVLVPSFTEANQHYRLAYDIPQEQLIYLAAVRQLFIDQGQSLNMYISEKNWNYEYLAELHLLAADLGLKSLYYLNTKKGSVHEACESCSS
jgi:ribonucleoside-diphosphate reductase alpha chain